MPTLGPLHHKLYGTARPLERLFSDAGVSTLKHCWLALLSSRTEWCTVKHAAKRRSQKRLSGQLCPLRSCQAPLEVLETRTVALQLLGNGIAGSSPLL